MNNINEKAMLVRQSISVWSGRKHDRKITREVLDQHHANAGAGRWHKVLIAKTALSQVNHVANLARAHHYEHTLPWEDLGARMLPSAEYFYYMEKQREFSTDFHKATGEFLSNYDVYVSDAEQALNSMFNAKDYPSAEKIRSRFAFDNVITPLPSKSDFRVHINETEVRRIQLTIEARTEKMLHAATQECWKRLHAAVERMALRLADDKSRIHDSLVGNLVDLVDLLPRLNLTNDPALERMRAEVLDKLCRTDANALRPNSKQFDPQTRHNQLTHANTLLESMEGYVTSPTQ